MSNEEGNTIEFEFDSFYKIRYANYEDGLYEFVVSVIYNPTNSKIRHEFVSFDPQNNVWEHLREFTQTSVINSFEEVYPLNE